MNRIWSDALALLTLILLMGCGGQPAGKPATNTGSPAAAKKAPPEDAQVELADPQRKDGGLYGWEFSAKYTFQSGQPGMRMYYLVFTANGKKAFETQISGLEVKTEGRFRGQRGYIVPSDKNTSFDAHLEIALLEIGKRKQISNVVSFPAPAQ